VVYARKKRPTTMPGPVLHAEAPSPTKSGVTPLIVSLAALDALDEDTGRADVRTG
jgi:hypothetical protein